MFFGSTLINQVLNLIFSSFPIATLLYLSYKIWERKRVPAGFFQFFFGLLLTFISSFQTLILVILFDYLYDYEATISTIVYGAGLVFSLWGLGKLGKVISEDLGREMNRIIGWVVLLCFTFLFVFYIPIYFKIQRTFVWKVGGLFYGFNSIMIWGIFTGIAAITSSIQELKNRSRILKILSFYFLIEPLIYLTLVSFEVLPKVLFTSRLIMSAISVAIAVFVVLFVFIFAFRYLAKFVDKIELIYSGRIKLVSLGKIKKFTLSLPLFISILLVLETFLIKTYLEREVRQYSESKATLLKIISNYLELELKNVFEKLANLSRDLDIVQMNIPSLSSKYADAFSYFPNYVRNISRVDERGVLRYTFPPDPKAIGQDVSYQEHNKRFLLRRKPQTSSVFRAVQGYDAIALHYPVFDSKGNFKGAVACLIDVKRMIEYFTNLVGIELDEFFVFNMNDSSILFAKDLSFVGGNLYDVLSKVVRSDVRMEIKGAFDNFSANGVVLKGRHKWGRKINFAFSFAKIELLQGSDEVWGIVNVIDEVSLLKRSQYTFRFTGYKIIFIALLLILGYLLYFYLSHVLYSFSLEDELNRQAREIIESEQKYRELANNPIVGLVIYDENGFIFFNKRLCEIFGYDEHVFKYLKMDDLVFPEDKIRWLERMKKILRGESMPEKAFYKGIRRDGGIVYLACYSRRIYYNGKPAVQSVIFDISKEKVQEDIIRHLQRVELIGTFAMGMAHDFNNILQVIIASAQMLTLKIKRGEFNQSELSRYIDNIISVSNRGAELIRRLKLLTRKEAPNLEVFEFDEIVKWAVEVLKLVFPKFIELEVKSGAPGVKIKGIKAEIQQVLLNIAMNARDAIVEKKEKGMLERQGKVVIEASINYILSEEADVFKVEPGKYICVSLTDNGIGMDEKTRERILEPFFTTKRPDIGTGLGMTTVFGIVRSHGGFLKVHSKYGEGTRVEVYLPIVEEGEEVLDLKIDAEMGSELNFKVKPAVMVVSVNDELRSKLEMAFGSAGIDALFCDDKVVAFKTLSENLSRVSLILIDSKTPRIKLSDLIAELRTLSSDIKIGLLYRTPEAVEVYGVEVFEDIDSEMERLIKVAQGRA